jgi:hypothetical protein
LRGVRMWGYRRVLLGVCVGYHVRGVRVGGGLRCGWVCSWWIELGFCLAVYRLSGGFISLRLCTWWLRLITFYYVLVCGHRLVREVSIYAPPRGWAPFARSFWVWERSSGTVGLVYGLVALGPVGSGRAFPSWYFGEGA